MIQNTRVLRPEFVPQDVVHRTQEVDALSAALDPLTEGEQGETVERTKRVNVFF